MSDLSPAIRHRLLLYFKVFLLTPFCVFLVMVPYSLLLRWNIITLIVFWFFIVPLLILYLHSKLFHTSKVTMKAMASLTVFYGFMVFMIYEHYQSDYFAIMMFSAGYNFLVMALAMWVQRADKVYHR